MKFAIYDMADGSVSIRDADDSRKVLISLACGESYEHVPKHVKAEAIVAAAAKIVDYLTDQKTSLNRSKKILANLKGDADAQD